jgi:Type II secretion system (T2SS), protein M subtype b
MTNFQTKKRLIMGGLAILLLADAGLLYFNAKLTSPENDRRLALAAETRQLALVKADVERASKIRQTIPDILKRFDAFEEALLPASKGQSVIAQELDDYARQTHLIVESVQIHQKDITGRNLTELHMEASVDGDYNGIVEFLNHLQRSKNVYIVDALTVESGDASHGTAGVLRVSLNMRTYFRKA